MLLVMTKFRSYIYFVDIKNVNEMKMYKTTNTYKLCMRLHSLGS